MKKVLLDTNMLMIPGQFGIDIFEEIDKLINENYELVTLSSVISELRKISKKKSKDGRAAKVALELVKHKNIAVISSKNKNVDEEIIKIVDKNTIVATNDIELERILKNKGIKTIYLRSKKFLEY